jgi:hypothetical protein
VPTAVPTPPLPLPTVTPPTVESPALPSPSPSLCLVIDPILRICIEP